MNKSIEGAIEAHKYEQLPNHDGPKSLYTLTLDTAIQEIIDNLKDVNKHFGGINKTTLLVGLLIAGLLVTTALHFQVASYLGGIFGTKLAEAITAIAATAPFTIPAAIRVYQGPKPGFYHHSQDLVAELEKHQPLSLQSKSDENNRGQAGALGSPIII